MLERTLSLSRPLSLRLTLGGLVHGNNPSARFDGERLWWATRTTNGPATIALSLREKFELAGRAWGPGAEFLLEHLEEIVGEHQDDGDFTTDNDLVASLHHETPGLRISRTLNVWEVASGTVLAQRVTGMEAARAHRNIVNKLGEAAPGPVALVLPPAPERIAELPYWWFHRFGVERKRADTLRSCAQHAKKLDALVDLTPEQARAKLLKFPGVGLWTAASVALVALGDQDAVPVGDFHFANHVAWALAGEVRGSDERMLQLLEPFSGHRGRVLRLLIHGHSGAPKFGPRYAPQPIASM